MIRTSKIYPILFPRRTTGLGDMAESKPPRVPPKDKPGSAVIGRSESTLRPSKSSIKRNFKHLTLPNPGGTHIPSRADLQLPGSRAATTAAASSSSQVPIASYDSLSDQFDSLELGVEFKLDLRLEDLRDLEELGFGNGGTVSKVQHVPTRTIMAKKVGETMWV